MDLPSPIAPALPATFYALGYGTGIAAFVWMAKRRRMATECIAILAAVGLIGALLGAHLAQWLAAGSGGKSVLGGLAGGYVAVGLAKRAMGIVRPTGDLFAVAIIAGEAVGRWGCYFGGCCYGRLSDLPWAVWQHGAYRHPTQIYQSVACAAILLVLLRLDRKRLPENALFFAQGVLYCAARFVIEFYRDVYPWALGLSAAQWACLCGGVFFAVRLSHLVGPSRTTVAEGAAA